MRWEEIGETIQLIVYTDTVDPLEVSFRVYDRPVSMEEVREHGLKAMKLVRLDPDLIFVYKDQLSHWPGTPKSHHPHVLIIPKDQVRQLQGYVPGSPDDDTDPSPKWPFLHIPRFVCGRGMVVPRSWLRPLNLGHEEDQRLFTGYDRVQGNHYWALVAEHLRQTRTPETVMVA